MAVKNDTVNTTLNVDGNQAINTLGRLEMDAKNAAADFRKLTGEATKLGKEIKKLEGAKIANADYDKAKNKWEEISKATYDARKQVSSYNAVVSEIGKVKEGTQEHKKLLEMFNRLSVGIDEAKAKNDLFNNSLKEANRLQRIAETANKGIKGDKDVNLQSAINEQRVLNNTIDNTRAKFNETNVAIDRHRQEIGVAGMTYRQLTNFQRQLTQEFGNTTRAMPRYNELAQELRNVNTAVQQHREAAAPIKGIWGGIKTALMQAGAQAIAFFGAQEIVGQIGNLIKGSADLSDQFADIAKTTNLTNEEIDSLNKNLKDIDTRTSSKELRNMAVVAGQMGVKGVKDITSFVEAADKINVALGKDFGGGADVVATRMAKLRNVFTDMRTDDIGGDMQKIGNALNLLSSEGSATAPVISDFASRIGGVGITLGLTTGQVLGLSSTLEEMSVNSERGGTAVVKIMQKMTTETEKFATVANMDVTEFTKLVNEDLFGAFMKVVEGSKKSGTSATALGGIIKDLDVDGAGASEVFAKLSGNLDLLKTRTDQATLSLTNTDSIMSEFNKKNENLAAKLEKIQKAIHGAFINSAVMNGIEAMIGGLYRLIEVPLSEKLQQEQIGFNVLAAQVMQGNLPMVERVKIIKKMQEISPDFIDGIDAQTASNEELSTAIKAVNAQIVNNILIQRNKEKIADAASDVVDAIEEKQSREMQGLQVLSKAQMDYGLEVDNTMSSVEQLKEAWLKAAKSTTNNPLFFFKEELGEQFRLLDEATKELERVQRIFDAIAAKKVLDVKGNVISEHTSVKDKTTVDAKTGGKTPDKVEKVLNDAAEALQKELDEYQKFLTSLEQMNEEASLKSLDKDARELKQLEDKYDAFQIALLGNYEAGLMTEEAYEARKTQIKLAFEAERNVLLEEKEAEKRLKRQEADTLIRDVEKTDEQLELDRINKHYIDLLAMATQFGLDKEAVIRAHLAAIAEMEKRQAEEAVQTQMQKVQAQGQLMGQYANMAGEILTFLAESEGENAKYQKQIALFQIAVDTASAIASTMASSTANPLNSVTFGAEGIAQFAAMSLHIGINMAKAVKLLSKSPPSAPKIKAPGFFEGGYTGSTLLPFGDQNGRFVGGVHGGEYVVPKRMMKNEYVMRELSKFENMRTKGTTGESTNNNWGLNTALLQEQNMLLKEMVQAQNRQQSLLANINFSSSIMFNQKAIYELRKEIKKQETIETTYKS